MARSSIFVDLDDPHTAKIADVISNKTAKKILALLAEKELGAQEISEKLTIPINTVGYNIKKLVDAGLVEKTNRIFWSSKGKKIEIYKVANKRIVISPRIGVRGVVPATIFTILATVGIKVWTDWRISTEKLATAGVQEIVLKTALSREQQSESLFNNGIYGSLMNAPDIWAWYMLGALTALLIVILWNWGRK